MSALLFPEAGAWSGTGGTAVFQNAKRPGSEWRSKRKPPNACFEQSSHPAVVLRCLGVRYSVWLRKCVSIKETGLYRECNP